MKHLVKSLCLFVADRSRLVRGAARFIHNNAGKESDVNAAAATDTYAFLKGKFIENGRQSAVDETARSGMVSRFEEIDRSVPIGSTPTDGLILAELLINCRAKGDVVECGCYAGGSSAKLSIVAKAVGRQLLVFDSFEGLPVVDSFNLRDKHLRRSEEWASDWTAGRYAARMDEVKGNISQFGEIDVCDFFKGWLCDTLNEENLPPDVAFAFTDVDIPSSARDCLVGLWPHLTDLGIYVSHDAAWVKVLKVLHDRKLWEEQFKSYPPIFYGAGFGIYDSSPHIGYFVAGEDVPDDYLKEITIDK